MVEDVLLLSKKYSSFSKAILIDSVIFVNIISGTDGICRGRIGIYVNDFKTHVGIS